MNSNTVKRQVAINEFAWMIVVTILIGLGPHSVGAQEKDQAKQDNSPAQVLPSGDEVMARHIKMTGGQAAYDALKNRVSESTLKMVGQEISLDVKAYLARPNKVYMIIESNLTGKIEKGCTGDIVWDNSLTAGPVVREGAEKRMMIRDSTFERFVHWRSVLNRPNACPPR